MKVQIQHELDMFAMLKILTHDCFLFLIVLKKSIGLVQAEDFSQQAGQQLSTSQCYNKHHGGQA